MIAVDSVQIIKFTVENLTAKQEKYLQGSKFFKSIFKPKLTFLGDVIPVSGDGNLTEGRFYAVFNFLACNSRCNNCTGSNVCN